MINSLFLISFFTFLIHITQSVAYSMRIAGLRTKQIAIAMSFVTSTLLISRLSNMFQAPLLGTMVDSAILNSNSTALIILEKNFRVIIFSAFIGSFFGALLTPTMIILFQKAIRRFLHHGSIPKMALEMWYPKNLISIFRSFRLPRLSSLKGISLKNIPKNFLILNILVTSIYTIGVLCSLLAGAYLPHLRSTAIQLSGLVNGIATILLTLFVDPSGARITDQAYHGIRPQEDVKSVVFFLLAGRLLGTLFIAQIFFKPFTIYIMKVTQMLAFMVH